MDSAKAQLHHQRQTESVLSNIGSELLLEGFPEKVDSFARHVLHLRPVLLLCVHFAAKLELLSTSTVQVVLRSINSSKSAYASVSFQSNFFDEYNVFQRNIVQAGVLMKVMLVVSPKAVAANSPHCRFVARPDSIPHAKDLPLDFTSGHRCKHPPACDSC